MNAVRRSTGSASASFRGIAAARGAANVNWTAASAIVSTASQQQTNGEKKSWYSSPFVGLIAGGSRLRKRIIIGSNKLSVIRVRSGYRLTNMMLDQIH